jgi:hypothetical protein
LAALLQLTESGRKNTYALVRDDSPSTIHIIANRKGAWIEEANELSSEALMLRMASVLSHESLHIAVHGVTGSFRDSMKMDRLFGTVQAEDFCSHGLYSLDSVFKIRECLA